MSLNRSGLMRQPLTWALFTLLPFMSHEVAAQSMLAVSPTAVSFPSGAVGARSAPQAVVVTNIDSAPHNVYLFFDPGESCGGEIPCRPPPGYSDFPSSTDCPTTPISLAAGGSCTVTLTFAPSGPGARQSNLAVYCGLACGSTLVPLLGLAPFDSVPTLDHWALSLLCVLVVFVAAFFWRKARRRLL